MFRLHGMLPCDTPTLCRLYALTKRTKLHRLGGEVTGARFQWTR